MEVATSDEHRWTGMKKKNLRETVGPPGAAGGAAGALMLGDLSNTGLGAGACEETEGQDTHH